MENVIFLKFGGSVITDKSEQESAATEIIGELARELQEFRGIHPEQQFIIGHGSGSFGHYYAAQYGIHKGLAADADWKGFALTGAAALRLNRIVVDALLAAGIPAFSIQPSASLRSAGGKVTTWPVDAFNLALQHRLVPVIHGDVAFDTTQGCAIISTEALFTYLARHTHLRPQRIVIVGEDAVYTSDPHIDPTAERIPVISTTNIEQVREMTGGALDADVTGGMRSKVELMWQLVQEIPDLEVQIIDYKPEMLKRALLKEAIDMGTIITL